MEYFELLKRRRSVRQFLPQPVEPEKLGALSKLGGCGCKALAAAQFRC